ncbi:MAG: hypothetical protein NTX79_01615 [Candidatus Micrarchaeota archaeon]|nr:hypothetical protein [Candidatus Micrarchaeota archaeon]
MAALITAHSGSSEGRKAPARNDPELAAYLARIGKRCETLGTDESQNTFYRLNSFAVAKAEGLWLFFKPEVETLRKKSRESADAAGKFIAVDVPKGMWSMGEGKMMVGVAPVEKFELHWEILGNLMHVVLSEMDGVPEQLWNRVSDGCFSLGTGKMVEIIGAGALEYRYSPGANMLEIFVDPKLSSTKFDPVPPDVLTEIVERANGCEGVSITRRCI